MQTVAFLLVIAALIGLAGWAAENTRRKYGLSAVEEDLIPGLPFTRSELEAEVEAGFVSARTHPDDETLVIYNYTRKTQYERTWNEVTKTCRGLILRGDWIVARPFAKFFNLEELDEVPEGPFVAQAKQDGSLGIIYLAPDGLPAVATRGSFASDQAIWATSALRANPEAIAAADDAIMRGHTLLVEIIYPENRIVVDYGDYAGLPLLASIGNSDGLDRSLPEWPWLFVVPLDALTLEDIHKINQESKGNQAEGFVLRYEDGTRVKVKAEDYVRLHRIVTGVTPRKIHDMLSNNISVDQWAEYVPDEFYDWMKAVSDDLEQQFTKIEQDAFRVLSQVPTAERKVQAEFVKKQKNSALVFQMLDQKPYSDMIWKMIRPEADSAFRVDIDV